jgi:hypothetical protein
MPQSVLVVTPRQPPFDTCTQQMQTHPYHRLQHAARCAGVTCLKAVTGDWILGQLSTRHEETGKTRGLQSKAVPTMPIYAQQSQTRTMSRVPYTHAFCNLSLIFNLHSRGTHPCSSRQSTPHKGRAPHTRGVLCTARKERKQTHENTAYQASTIKQPLGAR